jgi:hypothetical protein
MLNYAYISQILPKYETAYKTQTPYENEVASDKFIFNQIQADHYIMEPPACLEDNPTFGSMLGHEAANANAYKEMIAKYKREDYYTFS